MNKSYQYGSTCRVPGHSAVETARTTTELDSSPPRLPSRVGSAMLCDSRKQSWETGAERFVTERLTARARMIQ